MKRFVCLAVTVLTVLFLLAACQNKTEKAPSQSGDTETPTEAGTSPYLDSLPDDLDYGGREVNIFYSIYDPNFSCKAYELEGSGFTEGDLVSQAVYARNEEVQDRLNVIFSFTQVESASDAATYAKAIENNVITPQSTEYDLIYHRAANAVVHANMGYFKAVNDLPYVDWDQSYWFYDQMESVSLNKSQIYVMLGDLLVSNYSNITTMFFNMNLYENLFPDRSAWDLYTVVKDDAWTWEYYFDIISECYRDTDGEDGVTLGDVYGANWENGTRTVQYYPYTSGLSFTTRDDEGFPVFTLNTPRTVEMVEKLYGFIYDNPGTNMMTYDQAQTKFLNGTMVFYGYFLSIGKIISQSAEFDYGILPFPKYDGLTDYTSAMLTGAGVFVIPGIITDADRLSCIGATLEALCSANAASVVPKYYETVLKVQQSGTPQNKEMIEFIRAHLTFDLSFWMSDSLGKVAATFQQCIIKDKSSNYSATWQKYGSTYETALQNLIDSYQK